MKVLSAKKITEAIRDLCIQVNTDLPKDVERALEDARKVEASSFGRYALDEIRRNVLLAREMAQPMCQDTGITVVYAELGQSLCVVEGDFEEAIQEGVRRGYQEGFLRLSVVEEPVFSRTNTKDNTPAVIHTRIVPGDSLRLTVMPKGAGSENMGALAMLKPTVGAEGVVDFVVDVVRCAGGNPCPPIIIGVGIGGTMERAAAMAKEALRRPVGSHHKDPRYADLEEKVLIKVNKLGIGPQGLGGKVTALACHIETQGTHIATLPVAVNLNCHAARHHSVVLEGEEVDGYGL